MSQQVDLKVVLLGREAAGKTSLVDRFVHGRFADGSRQATVGAAFCAKTVDTPHGAVALGIWDTAGSERYESMTRIYYRGAGAAIVCFDLTEREGFTKASQWVRELRDAEEQCRLYVVGTKADLVESDPKLRQVPAEEAEIFAESLGAKYLESSSKTGLNIDALFTAIAEDFVMSVQAEHTQTQSGIVDLTKPVGTNTEEARRCAGCVLQ
eukprot:comp63682_c0_seq1/m.47957 comp63682_c0_seq1/g.47957  ORF comp63682_c0_seq1/g.47957 comp63682_c0_seq1/m.47957 type:complete len:210 (-) comp63682_c0_seq1:339-968(-)